MPLSFNDEDAARAILDVVGTTPWEAVAIARAFIAIHDGRPEEDAARLIFDESNYTLKRSREIVSDLKLKGFLASLRLREKVGSAENPITKLFPAAITERRFIELLKRLCDARLGLDFNDDRDIRHSLTDFLLVEGDQSLPVNIKNAGTQFYNARSLVNLEPDDCIPIPAYKAYGAVNKLPSLLYVISVDYGLAAELAALPTLLEGSEAVTWELLNKYHGSHLKKAEDAFVSKMTQKYWAELSAFAAENPFHVISARRAIRILQQKPERTPGIGLRAWGTGASAEVNVHISIKDETTDWEIVHDRILKNGIVDVINAVNRKRQEWVYDPEI
jgi:hypothetical protein